MNDKLPVAYDLAEYMRAIDASRAQDNMPPEKSVGAPAASAEPVPIVDAVESVTPSEKRTMAYSRHKRSQTPRSKRMTDAALAANRLNGSKSNGPSPEGAKRSRGSALKHGMTAQLPELLIGEAGEDQHAYAELKAIVLEAYASANRHDGLLLDEYVRELWRRYHRIEPVERALIRRRLLRRRRARGHDAAQHVQDLLAHNPAGLQDSVAGLRYLIDQLVGALVATRGLAADADVMQPVKQLSARLQDQVVALKDVAAQALTKRPTVIAAIEALQATLREALAEQETAVADLEDIEATLCVLPSGKSGENLLRHLRRSDRRLAQLRRVLEPLRRDRRRAADKPEGAGS